ncbi:uncharacterized protein LOC132722927 [Ruditapes philippinarum]|uniref:uncharacterized protein LOC132722927 n=1 Tax=Ruditapes philippinarum TaxID=129788 RepID=UPI00295C19CD|nr:uncharacterized protein LOC132722927 [Ruditapes philippinarum]
MARARGAKTRSSAGYGAKRRDLICGVTRPHTPIPGKIPQHIHQIFFYETSSHLPDKLVKAKNSWIQYHPNYTYTLWNKTSIKSLLEREYPFLRKLYDSYGNWVRRADVARYLVLYHYGGWYVDMDVACRRSVRTLEQEAQELNKTAILRLTEPVGFSNDFIGISERHPFLFSVLTSLHMSNRWFIFPYANTMFSTGPTFLWGRVRTLEQEAQELNKTAILRELFIVAGNRILVFEEVKTNKDIVEHQLPLTAQTLI